MTANHILKDQCKKTMNLIRDALRSEDRVAIEPHLRDLLAITKKLMTNAKVSPDDFDAAQLEIQRHKESLRVKPCENDNITREVQRLQDEVKRYEEEQSFAEWREDVMGRMLESSIHSGLYCMHNFLEAVSAIGQDNLMQYFEELYCKVQPICSMKRALLALCYAIAVLDISDNALDEELQTEFSFTDIDS